MKSEHEKIKKILTEKDEKIFSDDERINNFVRRKFGKK